MMLSETKNKQTNKQKQSTQLVTDDLVLSIFAFVNNVNGILWKRFKESRQVN